MEEGCGIGDGESRDREIEDGGRVSGIGDGGSRDREVVGETEVVVGVGAWGAVAYREERAS
jgi:hypothetical protein